ncbi:folate-binding protein YgfZ [Mycoavidus sp. B2-EB]|uniref:CAF17-like 4Fe-4S cluster assembly/insertion protein YgfZ n=1 Tax=Mycoavidus sp. B2-EB TaxID=2651972 RepID=UPI0016241F86|nr:folate-binding protein YgfZ [Mycoavidus sp. B2-EB]
MITSASWSETPSLSLKNISDLTASAFTILDQFSVLQATGPDAGVFLHGQLTNNIAQLATEKTQFAGLCSIKGRLLATFLVWRAVQPTSETAAETIQLMLSRDLQAAVQKRLSMFILRSKVKLNDVSDCITLIGLTGAAVQLLAPLFPNLPEQAHSKVESAAGTLIRLSDVPLAAQPCASESSAQPTHCARYLWAAPQPIYHAQRATLSANLASITPAIWDWLEIHAGEPRITEATQDQFVPQMVNFEVIGGVDFRKGCYPGQEIIARSQYRGTIKRRMMLAHADQAEPGAEVFHFADPQQPCGMVVNVAPAPGGGVDCLVEVKLAMLEPANGATIHVGTLAGPVLKWLALPYALPATGSL